MVVLGGLAVLLFYGAFQHATEEFSAWYFYVSVSLSALFLGLAVWRFMVILKRHGRENLIQ